jgi:8-amino-7-oxononanoate synthase
VSDWSNWVSAQLAQVEAAGQWRMPVPFDGSLRATLHGREVINFAANDYLGLGFHPAVSEAAREAIGRWGTGAGAARLVTGTRSLHAELEASIAAWKKAAKALVFPTGYAANIGVLTTLGASDVTIFSDALNHASIIDGCRLSKARTVVFAHNDVVQLEQLMASTPGRKLVVTEAVFSMDGDAAPLRELSALCARHGALLVVDEAHAVLGPELDAVDCEYLRVGTLSKTLGALGGWVAGAKPTIDLLVNRARTFIFTTALSPPDTAAALTALNILCSEEGERLRRQLRRHIDAIRPAHPSPIVPIVLGSEAAALSAARALLDHGIYIPAIRPPTVPTGTSRLRLTVSAAHSDDMIARLRAALAVVVAGVR